MQEGLQRENHRQGWSDAEEERKQRETREKSGTEATREREERLGKGEKAIAKSLDASQNPAYQKEISQKG